MFGANTKLHVDVPHTKDSTFLMRRDKGRITFVCDKKAIHTEIPADAPSGPGAFGVGIIATPGIGYTDIWNIEARKLTAANRAEKPIDSVKPKPAKDAPAPVPDEKAKPSG